MSFLAPLIALTIVSYAPTQAGSAPLTPELEVRVQGLGKQLRCAVCQGLSVTDSPSSMARAQLDKIRELVSAGKTDDEVREYFVARYGEWVLLSPPASGFNWIVWLGPAALLLIGAVVIALQLKKRPPGAGPPALTTAPPAEDPYLKAVRSETEQ